MREVRLRPPFLPEELWEADKRQKRENTQVARGGRPRLQVGGKKKWTGRKRSADTRRCLKSAQLSALRKARPSPDPSPAPLPAQDIGMMDPVGVVQPVSPARLLQQLLIHEPQVAHVLQVQA